MFPNLRVEPHILSTDQDSLHGDLEDLHVLVLNYLLYFCVYILYGCMLSQKLLNILVTWPIQVLWIFELSGTMKGLKTGPAAT